MKKIKSDITKCLKRIEQIKKEIIQLDELRVGSISKQYNICGNPNCRCKDPENPQKHGPYYQLSYSRYGKSSSQFIKEEDVPTIQQHVNNYKTFMALKDEWIDLSIEIGKLRKNLQKKPSNKAE